MSGPPGADRQSLPIDPYLAEITDSIDAHPVTLVVAPPGCGKTTRVPAALLGDPRRTGSVVLEPRRVAARSAAHRIASEQGTVVGDRVGFSVRGERRVGNRTRLEVVTDGLFVRRLQSDPELEGVDVVVIDEFHERRLSSDLAFALCMDIAGVLRPDLRIVLMSATPDVDAVVRAVPGVRVLEVPSPGYPVGVSHLPPQPKEGIIDTIDRAVRDLEARTDGDILVFVPGRREIDLCLERSAGWSRHGVGLHGSMSPTEQARVVGAGDRPRVVVATNVAESSVTVEGVTAVVDSGLRRAPVRDLSGLSPLRTVRASRSSVDQRAGRAGRLGPGRVLRLWDGSVDESLADVDPPEIAAVELDDLVLQLAIWGADPDQMTWLTAPKAEDLDAATSTLQQLGLVDHQARPTELGRTAAGLGVSARLAKVALELAPRLGAVDTACLIAVIESGARGELIDLANAERRAPSRQTKQLARRIGDVTGIGAGDRAGDSLELASEAAEFVTGSVIAAAFPQLIARRRPDGRYLLACGRGASSPTFSAEWLAVTAVSGQGPDVRIDAAVEIDRVAAVLASPPEETTTVQWSADRRVAIALTRTHIGAIELSTDSRTPTKAEALEALRAYVRTNGIEALDEKGHIATVLMRWNAVAAVVEDMEAIRPDLLADDIGWLADYTDLTRPLGASTIASAMLAGRSWDASLRLDDLAPTRMTTPIGSVRQIDWSSGVPVLAAPLQEYLGCTTHPAVAGGRLPVTLELLSPAMRPVQRTTDIAGFWRGSYMDVRKDLRGRYPKHHWPENPETAEPWRPGMPKRPS